MQGTKSQTNFNDDGFQSDDQPRTDLIKMPTEEPREKTIALEEYMIKYIPPPQDIVAKSYSLHPDIITGWAPKISLPKPIPLTFLFQLLSRMLKAYDKIDTSQVQLKFLGPRFDSTYSSWKLLSNQFPYTHLGERKVLITDRKNEQRKVINNSWQVKFDSLFESGNLDAVFQVGEYEYDCFMRVDTNTKGHLQWFYFRMSNLRAQVKYKINICNFQKSKTLYLRGMKPYIYSAFQFINTGIGWHQRGQNVEYSKRIPKSIKTILYQNDEFESKYYTLSFTISTQIQSETLELAYCPPYTYSKLVSFLKDLSKNNKSRNIIVEDQLCLSLGGFKIPFLTITSQASQAQSQFKNNCAVKEKSLIFLTGRIHPGECNGSYMMQGFLSWICGSTALAQQLRNKYIFKVVPMVNPDGVIMGNYRTGLSGKDFNREFTQPDPTWFVQISQLKNEIQKCQWIYQKKFNFFLDFHGHTVKKNIFAYGPQFPLIHSKYYECRLFPKLLSQKTELFRYYSCMFKVAASKVATARAILLREYGIPFTYTIQASNGCFYDQESKKDVAFDINKWLIVGSKIGQALFEYMKILNKIQEESLNRKKNREERQKNKMEKMKRIQSSVDKRHHKSLVSNKQKIAVRIQEKTKNKLSQNFYNNILKEIIIDKQIENKKCSDDQLSQGKSDSQNSDDDLQATALKNLLLGVKKPTKKIHILKNLQQKKSKEDNIMKIIQKSSFITDIQQLPLQNEKDRYSPIEKRKRQSNCRRKIYTVSSIPSPTRDQDMSNPKIINISFIINPVPISNSYVGLPERRIRQKTDNYEFQNENKQTIKQQTSDSFRRTYLSLQREILKKQMLNKISIFGKSFSTSKDNFKMQEVVGKRIFNEN